MREEKIRIRKIMFLQYLGISLRLFIFVFDFWIQNCSDELHFLMI